jgi:superfamily II DNA or RNA helicase
VGLTTLALDDHYRSGENDMVGQFYLPCLTHAVTYDRAVGYFSSGCLRLALRGIANLIRNGGKIRLVISPALTAADLKAIEEGYEERLIIDEVVLRTSHALLKELPKEQLGLLRWLIAQGYLDIKVATVKGTRPSIYHEKFGIFTDIEGSRVVFVGSSNETVSGLLGNFESIEVFRSWYSSETERISRRVKNFDNLWEGLERGLEITPFPDAALRVIIDSEDIRVTLEAFDVDQADGKATEARSERPSLRDYQSDAITAWVRNAGRGIIAMATGTGKTITALSLACKLLNKFKSEGRPLSVVIVVPYKHLVTQWRDVATRFDLTPILCFESRELWEERARAETRAVQDGTIDATILIVTSTTFMSAAFQAVCDIATSSDTLLVVDEVHNMGAARGLHALSERVTMRLGLSATPQRHYDPDGTDALLKYFGGVIFEIDLSEAIRRKILVPYRYFVHRVQLTSEESQTYIQLTKQITKIGVAREGDPEDVTNDHLKRLLIRRARIVSSATNKLPLLLRLMKNEQDHRFTLVYCGDGKVDRGGDERLVNSVVARLLEAHRRADSYTASTDVDSREWLRETFAAGELEYLVAIRCLDEGIDIPEARRAYFLASSTNPRQFVQRRGRVLRRSDETGKRRAEIHDMLAILSPDVGEEESFYAQNAILRELPRIREFAQGAENGPQVLTELLDLPVTAAELLGF